MEYIFTSGYSMSSYLYPIGEVMGLQVYLHSLQSCNEIKTKFGIGFVLVLFLMKIVMQRFPDFLKLLKLFCHFWPLLQFI